MSLHLVHIMRIYARLIVLLLLVAVTLSAASHRSLFHVSGQGRSGLGGAGDSGTLGGAGDSGTPGGAEDPGGTRDPDSSGSPGDHLVPPPLAEGSAVLYDLTSGQFLLTYDAHRRRPPGSLTKVATAIVLLEKGIESEANVQVSREAAYAPGYNLLLDVGELIEWSELIKALLLLPGTDAATALAEHIAGSTPGFVADMNAWAQKRGLEQTHFENPHGLDTAGHRSSAHDLALIAAWGMQNETFRSIVATRRSTLKRAGDRIRHVRNVNSFLWRFPDAMGVKSSYTPESGYSLIGAARRNRVELLVVVLAAPSSGERYDIASSLLEYGFAHYDLLREAPRIERMKYVVREGDTLTGIARAFGISPGTIQKLNGISDTDRLRVGEELWIPR